MKFANHAGRAVLVVGDGIVDIFDASGGAIGPDPMDAIDMWDDVVALAATSPATTGPLVHDQLGNPVPRPRQVFAIGLNYRSHAEESGMAIPEVPATFTKYPESLSGPYDDIPIVGDSVDWEVELVVVIGRRATGVTRDQAWTHIAGLTVGQDVSDRQLQFAAGMQFSLGSPARGSVPWGRGW